MARNSKLPLPPPFLKRVWLEMRHASPIALLIRFASLLLAAEFKLRFDKPITIIVGENGVGN